MFVLYGFCIGIADLVPGVSGATVASILNIYPRVISVINSINLNNIMTLLKLFFRIHQKEGRVELKEKLHQLDLFFFVQVIIGDLIAILTLAGIFNYLLEYHHDATYGFFMGLIVTSLFLFAKHIKGIAFKEMVVLFLSVALLIFIGEMYNPLDNFMKKSLLYQEMSLIHKEVPLSFDPVELVLIFFTGILIASAMILPGISGSFVLLLLGQYPVVISNINSLRLAIFEGHFPTEEVVFLSTLAVGVIIGIVITSKVIYVLLEKYAPMFYSLIFGLLLGSLYIIWPFKETTLVSGFIKENHFIVHKDNIVIYLNKNILPQDLSASTVIPIVCVIVGALCLVLLNFFNREKKS